MMPAEAAPSRVSERVFLQTVFAWMALALAVSAGVAAYLHAATDPLAYVDQHPQSPWILYAGQLGLVILIRRQLRRASAQVAACLFAVYAASIGVTFAVLLDLYTQQSVLEAFVGGAGLFAGMAAHGYTTKRDYTRFGGLLWGVFAGVFISSIIWALTGGAVFNLALGIVGTLLFSALAAYDMQRLKQWAASAASLSDAEASALALRGALMLYISFINLVLSLLRIIGGRR
jgi:FtsH-binding integral membrane protein